MSICPGTLYLVPTPIGHLDDMTFRAVETLKRVDIILAEDTRSSQKLLKHYQINTPCKPYHSHNEHKVLSSWITQLKSGLSIALISDAGTPGISDPGYLLAKACIEAGVAITVLPGATALIPALVGSGLPAHAFCFAGFLPVKKGRLKLIDQLAALPYTVILYESPHRLLKTLNQLCEKFGPQRRVCVCREISKIYETFDRGTLQDVLAMYRQKPKIQGEIVLVIEGLYARGEHMEVVTRSTEELR